MRRPTFTYTSVADGESMTKVARIEEVKALPEPKESKKF